MKTLDITYCWLLTVCILIAFIFLLKFIQTTWLRCIEKRENEKKEISRNSEQVEIHKRKLELMDKQEEIKKFERLHEIEMKKIK